MIDSGITIPVELIHWGVDENIFKKIERIDDGIFTFGTLGALSTRKGTDILVNAFLRAFPKKQNDVRLICKTSYKFYPFLVNDKRIEVQMDAKPIEEVMDEFYKRVDCFVFPTRGEGFGLTPLEAMATGIPAIVTDWSGPAEYMNEDIGWKLNYEMTVADNFSKELYKEDCGEWAEPDEDQLVDLLRYTYEHQNEVKEKGNNAAKFVLENWTWNKKISMFHEALAKHL
jgi:glycosyltransferase involved in cell wall biosynthesis